MIKINLLSEGRRPVIARKTTPKLTLGDQEPSLLFLGGGVLLGLLVAGFQWWGISSQLKDVDRQVRKKQAEVEELRPILEEVAEFEAKQQELQRKIDVINELTLRQEGPVHIMDKISQALPDLLWINQMNVRGRTVDINGTAFNTNAVASFIENLDKVPEFKEPDPKGMNASQDGSTYNFRISFNFIQEKPKAEAEAETEVAAVADTAEG